MEWIVASGSSSRSSSQLLLTHAAGLHLQSTLGSSGQWVLGLAAWPVLVVRVLLHVQGPQALGLIDEWSFLRLGQQLPLGTQALGDLRVVHLGVILGDLTTLQAGPDHERVHWTLDVTLLSRRCGQTVHAGGLVTRTGVETTAIAAQAALATQTAGGSDGTVGRQGLLGGDRLVHVVRGHVTGHVVTHARGSVHTLAGGSIGRSAHGCQALGVVQHTLDIHVHAGTQLELTLRCVVLQALGLTQMETVIGVCR